MGLQHSGSASYRRVAHTYSCSRLAASWRPFTIDCTPALIQPARKSWTVTRSHPSTFGIMVETVAAARVRAQNSYLARPQTSIPRFPTTGPCIRRQSRTCQHQMSSQLSLHNHARGRSQLRCTSPTTRRNDSHMSRHLNDSSHLSPAREL